MPVCIGIASTCCELDNGDLRTKTNEDSYCSELDGAEEQEASTDLLFIWELGRQKKSLVRVFNGLFGDRFNVRTRR